jgi:hypothetical protein
MGAHRVMLCNQASDFGSKLQQSLDLTRTILSLSVMVLMGPDGQPDV